MRDKHKFFAMLKKFINKVPQGPLFHIVINDKACVMDYLSFPK